jgi:transposase
MWVYNTLLLGGDFFMVKKGQTFQRYTEEFKKEAVQRYEKGEESYRVIAADLGLRSPTQLKQWVKKDKKGEAFDLRGKGKGSKEKNPLKGRQRTHFQSVEEERDYLKAQVDYLKKRYPNLHKEDRSPK